MLQTSVMHQALATDEEYWRDDNIETCFTDCIRELVLGIRERTITDLFFKKVQTRCLIVNFLKSYFQCNMMDRFKKHQQVLESAANFLEKNVNSGSLTGFFPNK